MYFALKSLHVLAVTIFLGNIITGLFWKAHADRTGDARARAQALDGIIQSDRWFTVPGVVVIIASGVALAVLGGFPLLRTRWIAWSIGLFAISGLIFAFAVAPMQQRLRKLAVTVQNGGEWDGPAYAMLSRSWEAWGLISIALPLAALVLMVFKPA
jgi:uncharacterized membrane protein